MKTVHLFAALSFGLAALAHAAAPATTYTLIPLDAPADPTVGGSVVPGAVSDAGLVIGILSFGSEHGCVWLAGADGAGHARFPLPEPMGTASSHPTGVNAGGRIVGYFNTGDKDHACSWQGKDGALTPLSEEGVAGLTTSRALAVNDAGLVVGFVTDASGDHACTWNGAGAPSILPVPNPTLATASYAQGVSGDLVVGSFTDATGSYACAWHDGVLVSASGLKQPAPSAAGTSASGANASGLIVGNFFDASANAHGCTWLRGSADSAATSLPDLTLGGSSSVAGVSASGLIVGYSLNGDSLPVACAWFEGAPLPLPAPAGSLLSYATGVSARGLIVAYSQDATGFYQPYILVPTTSRAVIAPPTIAIKGKKKVTTTKAKLMVKGSTTGSVTSVTYRIGKKKANKRVTGTTVWKFKAALKPGRNKLLVTAHGPGGDSVPAKLIIIRRAAAPANIPR